MLQANTIISNGRILFYSLNLTSDISRQHKFIFFNFLLHIILLTVIFEQCFMAEIKKNKNKRCRVLSQFTLFLFEVLFERAVFNQLKMRWFSLWGHTWPLSWLITKWDSNADPDASQCFTVFIKHRCFTELQTRKRTIFWKTVYEKVSATNGFKRWRVGRQVGI